MSEIVTWRVPKARLFSAALPKETRTYKPVSHRELADVTMNAIHKAGFKLDKQEYSSARKGLVAAARYTISDVADKEMQLEIGWQNSYDKTLSLKFAIGTRIMICENGCVSGDLGAFARKHMGEVKTFAPASILESIKGASKTFETIQNQRDLMKSIGVTKQTQAELLGRMFLEKEMINSSQLNIIRKELKHPTHDYKSAGSMWELYNHTTFAMKHLHPRLWMDHHVAVHKFFNEATLPPKAPITSHIKTTIDPAQRDIYEQIAETE